MEKIKGLVNSTEKLKELIKAYPDYPIVAACGEDCSLYGYMWTFATNVTFAIGEILNCEQNINPEKIYYKRDTFYDDLEEALYYRSGKMSEAEFLKKLKEEKIKYDPYWVNCIFIYVDN